MKPTLSVVLRSLNYRGPGSSSRPKGLNPANADADHTHFTTLAPGTASRHPQTTAGADDLGPSADDPFWEPLAIRTSSIVVSFLFGFELFREIDFGGFMS